MARTAPGALRALDCIREFSEVDYTPDPYRYIEEVQLIGRPVPVVEAATAVTFKLPPGLVDAVRARAAAEGTTISDMVSRALRAFLGEAGGNG